MHEWIIDGVFVLALIAVLVATFHERVAKTNQNASESGIESEADMISNSDHHVLDKILCAIREENHILRRILRHLNPKSGNVTAFAAIQFGGFMASVAGTQSVGSTLTATFVPIEADGLTVTPGAKLTTFPAYTIDNTAVATLVDNGDGTATITGVSAGIATVTATGGVFTDQDGTATSPLTATNSDTVTQPTGRTVSAQINFTAPATAAVRR